MNGVRVEQQHWQNPSPQPSGSGFGYLLIVLLSLFLSAMIAYSVNQLTELPLLMGAIVAIGLCAARLFFLRYRPLYERTVSSGWDRWVGYFVIAFFSVSLAAYGLYSFDLARGKAVDERQPERPNRPVIVPPVEEGEEGEEERMDEDNPDEGGAFEEYKQRGRRNQQPINPSREDEDEGRNGGWDEGSGGSRGERMQNNLARFAKETLALSDKAVGCWLVAIVLEIVILILVFANRPRHFYGE